jgi:hypothetical chaperone protein
MVTARPPLPISSHRIGIAGQLVKEVFVQTLGCSMEHHVGIDFGTTNSAVALATRSGDVRLVPLPGPGGAASTWRTVLYIDPSGDPVIAGAPAIAAYLDAEGEGRLVQSIKSHLASASFTRTHIAGRAWTLEDLVAAFLDRLRHAAGVDLGRRAVVGRPVRYWGAESAEDDERAVARMRTALAAAGFDDVTFVLEPVAAAARYAATLTRDELVLVADFGGGTTDFSLARVGARGAEILGTGGIGVSGDAFDARVIDAVVAPALGRGTTFLDEMGAETPVPVWLFHKLRRWHHLSFLKAPETLRLLARLEHGAREPARIERLVQVVRDDLGLPMHQAVERAKIALSVGGTASSGRVDVPALELDAPVTRGEFDAWIEPDLAAIDAVVERVLADAGVQAREVDRVFATGGSSLVPAVRARLEARFGVGKVVGGEELTSVCWGLAARAHQLFA